MFVTKCEIFEHGYVFKDKWKKKKNLRMHRLLGIIMTENLMIMLIMKKRNRSKTSISSSSMIYADTGHCFLLLNIAYKYFLILDTFYVFLYASVLL